MPEPPGTPATVLIADDHTLFREGLAALISRWSDFELVGSAGDGHEAVRLSRRLQPQLVLMDVRMPVLGGVEATRQIRVGQPATKVVMLTMSTLGEDVFEALRNGAHGFLSKDEPPERLHDFLVDVLKGEVALSGAIAGKVLAEFGGIGPRAATGPSGGRESLSPRERDVLRLLVDGLSNDEIARRMCVSEATVKKHLGRVMTKLHLRNRVQVAVYSVRIGLVD
jgi:DNA-binding NarL/FixJ family response regulator